MIMPLADYIVYDETGKQVAILKDEYFPKGCPTELNLVGKPGWRAIKKLAIPAKPSKQLGGASGVYDRGLGCHYSSYAEREKICRERNIAPLSDFHNNFAEDMIEKQIDKRKRWDEFNSGYEQELQRCNGNEVQAQLNYMPDSDILEDKGAFELIAPEINAIPNKLKD